MKSLTLLCLYFTFLTVTYGENLIENSSFEVGIGGWGQTQTNVGLILKPSDLDSDVKYHGNWSLKISSSERKLNIASKCYKLKEGSSYIASAFIRSSKPCSVSIELTNFVYHKQRKASWGYDSQSKLFKIPANKWTRIHVPLEKAKCTTYDIYTVKIMAQSNSDVWVDAVQLEEARKLSEFKLKNKIEAGTVFKELGRIIEKSISPVNIETYIFNDYKSGKQAIVKQKVFDIDEELIFKNEKKLNIPKNKTYKFLLTIPNIKKGLYRILTEVDGYNPVDEKVFSILPKPKEIPPEKSIAGAYISLFPDSLGVMQKAGFRWTATLSVARNLLRWNTVNEKQGEYRWYDDWAQLPKKYGMKIFGNLTSIKKVPGWVKKEEGLPDIDAYAEHIKTVVTHYKNDIQNWIIEDEAEGLHIKSKDYAKYHKVAYKTIKKINKEHQVILSGAPKYIEEVIKYNKGIYADYYHRGSTVPSSRQKEERKHKYKLTKQYKVKAMGGGLQYCLSPYLTYPDFKSYSDTVRINSRRKNINEIHTGVLDEIKNGTGPILIYDARFVGNYPYKLHSKHIVGFDGTLTAEAVAYACLWSIMDGAKYDKKTIESLDKKLRVSLFKTYEGNSILAASIHTGELRKYSFNLPRKYLKLSWLDAFSNTLTFNKKGSSLKFSFDEKSFFIQGKKNSLLSLMKYLSKIKLQNESIPFLNNSLVDKDFAVAAINGNYQVFLRNNDFMYRDMIKLRSSPSKAVLYHTKTSSGLHAESRQKYGDVLVKRLVETKNKKCDITWTIQNKGTKDQTLYFLANFNQNIQIDKNFISKANSNKNFPIKFNNSIILFKFHKPIIKESDDRANWNINARKPGSLGSYNYCKISPGGKIIRKISIRLKK